jgi:hypothetical protein
MPEDTFVDTCSLASGQAAKVVFLVSQPRAGSTMTQKILGSHSRIHTQAEPWVLLHPLHSLLQGNLIATYNHKLSVRGTRAFVASLPGGEELYRKELGEAYLRMYGSILAAEGKEIFLDKTPRYYLIAREISRFFPESVVICLIRNPLAVLNSIVATWTRSKLYTLSRFRQDLLEAPLIFRELLEQPDDNTVFLRYEDLVVNPEQHIIKLCDKLGISFEPSMVEYKRDTVFALGDRKSVDQLGGPDASLQDGWISGLADPQLWRLQKDYFDILGSEVFTALGYDSDLLEETISSCKPSPAALCHTVPLEVLLDDQRDPLLAVHRLHREMDTMRREIKGLSGSLEYRLGRLLTKPWYQLRRLGGVSGKRR